MVRNTLKYVSDKDRKAFSTDLKTIYHAANEEKALEALEKVTEKWTPKYPNSMKRWHDNWDVVSPIFKFSMEVRRVIYTTYTDKKTIPTFPEIPATTEDFRKNIGIVFYRRYKASAIFSSFQLFPVFSFSGFVRSIALASVSSVTKA